MTTAPELLRQEIQRLAGCDDEDALNEAEHELRGSYDDDAEGICEWDDSRHYSVKTVYKKIGDQYVCWLYWFGGGKHGEPRAVDWIDDAKFIYPDKLIQIQSFRETP